MDQPLENNQVTAERKQLYWTGRWLRDQTTETAQSAVNNATDGAWICWRNAAETE